MSGRRGWDEDPDDDLSYEDFEDLEPVWHGDDDLDVIDLDELDEDVQDTEDEVQAGEPDEVEAENEGETDAPGVIEPAAASLTMEEEAEDEVTALPLFAPAEQDIDDEDDEGDEDDEAAIDDAADEWVTVADDARSDDVARPDEEAEEDDTLDADADDDADDEDAEAEVLTMFDVPGEEDAGEDGVFREEDVARLDALVAASGDLEGFQPGGDDESVVPTDWAYCVFATLPTDLEDDAEATREMGEIESPLPPGLDLTGPFRARSLPAVWAALDAWAAEYLPLRVEIVDVVAEVVGAQQYVAGWQLDPPDVLNRAQKALRDMLAPLITPLTDAAPSPTDRVLIGDEIPARTYPHVVARMQSLFEVARWSVEEAVMLRAPVDDGVPGEWDIVFPDDEEGLSSEGER